VRDGVGEAFQLGILLLEFRNHGFTLNFGQFAVGDIQYRPDNESEIAPSSYRPWKVEW